MTGFNKKIIFIKIICLVILFGCSQPRPITKDQLKEIFNRPFSTWTIDECDIIIKVSTISNAVGITANQIYDDVYITATILDHISIPAIISKEAILQRLSEDDLVSRLTLYLEEFTNYTFDPTTAVITEKNTEEVSQKGLSFQIIFRNVSRPYRTIEVEDGYSYFFLENDSGDFGRVIDISGDHADNHFVLGDYLRVTVTFSRTTDSGKLLFPDDNRRPAYKLIFNGLQKESIVLDY